MNARFAERIAESVATAPPLTPEQVDRLAVLLRQREDKAA